MPESPAALPAPTLDTALAEAAIATFERLAYCFAERCGGAVIPTEDVDGVVAITFAGPSRGGIVLQLSGRILSAMTANMLGVDEQPSAAEEADALGEVVNIICGNVLPRVAGASAVFSLGSPTHFRSWEAALSAIGPPSAITSLTVESGQADLAFAMSDSRD